MAPNAVFVYGTLLPGEERWPILEPFVVDAVPATVAGALYDTGYGYPAAVFTEPGAIEGTVFTLDERRMAAALAALDEAEAVDHGLYERTVLGTDHGPAWAYEYRGGVDHLTPLGTSWRDRPGGKR